MLGAGAIAAELLSGVLDLVYPRECTGCGRQVSERGRHLCWDCRTQCPPVQAPYCQRCGDPVDGDVQGEYTCSWCRYQEPAYRRARSAVRYRGPAKHLLMDLKYDNGLYLVADAADYLLACIESHYGAVVFDGLCVVPLHPARERERGYNQSALLGGVVARHVGLPLAAHALMRIRATGTQTALTGRARRRNVKGAFVCSMPAWVRGKTLLLIDDVMTTGATVAEASYALHNGGAGDVYVATVARG